MWWLLFTDLCCALAMRSQDPAFPQMSPPRVHGHPVSQPQFPRHANFKLEGSGRTPGTDRLGGIRVVGSLHLPFGPLEHLRSWTRCYVKTSYCTQISHTNSSPSDTSRLASVDVLQPPPLPVTVLGHILMIVRSTHQMKFRCFCNSPCGESISQCGRMSGTWFIFPSTLANFNLCSAAICCIQRNPVSMCLVLPRPFLWMMPRAALASPCPSPTKSHLKSFPMDNISSVSAAAFSDAYNSNSPELSAMRDYVRLHDFMCVPIITHPPVVDFLLCLHPTQSASLYVFTTL